MSNRCDVHRGLRRRSIGVGGGSFPGFGSRRVDLLIVRHGQAGTREEFANTGESDDHRPLTPEGARQFTKVARGLQRIVSRIDLLATSPLARAQQTAEILGERFGVAPVETETLRPDAAYAKFAS